jgi:hypothetical protein
MTDLVSRTKTLLYGSGLGEKPVIVRAAADAAETIAPPIITFDLLAGEGAASGIAAGDTLSMVGGTTAALSSVFYVLSVSVDRVTCLNSYLGSTPVSVADLLDGVIFELNPARSEFMLWNDVSAVIAGMLWPQIYLYSTSAITTPDLADYQNEVAATVEEIIDAHQVISNTIHHIPFELHTNVHTTVSSTGAFAELYAIDGSTIYLVTKDRVAETSTLNEAYMQCIATGAAAIAAGSMLGGGSLESSSKDSQARVQLTPRQALWQDFIALRSSIAQDLSMEEGWFSVVL